MATIYDANGVEAWEYQPKDGLYSWFGVYDSHVENYRITFFADEHGTVSVGVDARWNDTASGLANFTHDIYVKCGPEECGDTLSISDDGLLTAMERVNTASAVCLSKGLTLRLPPAYVVPIRLAIAKAHEMAKARADAAAAGKPVNEVKVLTSDEYAAAYWYLDLINEERAHWARQAGNTGLTVDAWRASQAPHAVPFGWAEVTA
ncbi:hypothetical protein RMR16_026885 (plasmid) [Agrobacterium sp. rho-13.3]|uniref:hypothetical protein n=1 Tax=Agrobacterium sp. rho-13.3 TaxID=3072980 RepID=UPI002A0E5FC2|nr:hypothetical protein [Agrobacterium sp. rho-13.3]MDX8311568.1 hypothetical protein [Agrobacterium sp. rho-13.3]